MSHSVEKKQPPTVISQATPVPCKLPGLADVVGFGPRGVEILRNRFDPQKELAVKAFGNDAAAGGWSIATDIRLVADTTGNGQADVVGFGQGGVHISLNKGDNTFEFPPKKVSDDFSSKTGWQVDKHIRFMADIKRSGRADIVGFGDAGTYISINHGNSEFGRAALAIGNFGRQQGWDLTMHLRFLADVNGNGLLDIVGFGQTDIWVALNNGDGTFQPVHSVLKAFCFDQGWKVDENPRFLADLTGDGKVDIVGFGADGVYIALNKGDGTFHEPKKVIDNFSVKQGWSFKKHVRTVADLTGKGLGDIVGFGEKDVFVAINKGNGTFEPVKPVLAQFTISQGWEVGVHPRVLVDITGDGKADIVGFGANGIWVAYSTGNGDFSPAVEIYKDFGSNNPGWSTTVAVKFLANI